MTRSGINGLATRISMITKRISNTTDATKKAIVVELDHPFVAA
jgi:hypothetical protein